MCWGITNATLSFYECSFSGGETIYLIFLHSKMVGTQNFGYKCSHPSHLVEFPLPNFLLVFHWSLYGNMKMVLDPHPQILQRATLCHLDNFIFYQLKPLSYSSPFYCVVNDSGRGALIRLCWKVRRLKGRRSTVCVGLCVWSVRMLVYMVKLVVPRKCVLGSRIKNSYVWQMPYFFIDQTSDSKGVFGINAMGCINILIVLGFLPLSP